MNRAVEHYNVAKYIAGQLDIELPVIAYRRAADNACGWVSPQMPTVLNMNDLYQAKDCLTKPEIDHYTRVITHEMAHMKQFISGKLEVKSVAHSISMIYWEGKLTFTGNIGTARYEVYNSFPWEIEARMLEQRLSNKYLQR